MTVTVMTFIQQIDHTSPSTAGMTQKQINHDMNLRENNTNMCSAFLMCCIIILTANTVMTTESVLST